ncbi:uncharacterized protein LOC144344802 [Saccoglossus kowalevskii]
MDSMVAFLALAFVIVLIGMSTAQNLNPNEPRQPQQQQHHQCVYQISVPKSSESQICPSFLEFTWDIQQLTTSNQQLNQTVEELQNQLSTQVAELHDIKQQLESREIVGCHQMQHTYSENGFQNGDFESEGAWSLYHDGFSYVDEEVYTGSFSIKVTLDDVTKYAGARQILTFPDGDFPTHMVVYGWSKAVDVVGNKNSDYSIYCDIIKSDDTPSWSHTANFNVGTHDWEEQQTQIHIEDGIKQATCYALFRKKTGTVYFDNIYADIQSSCKTYCIC